MVKSRGLLMTRPLNKYRYELFVLALIATLAILFIYHGLTPCLIVIGFTCTWCCIAYGMDTTLKAVTKGNKNRCLLLQGSITHYLVSQNPGGKGAWIAYLYKDNEWYPGTGNTPQKAMSRAEEVYVMAGIQKDKHRMN